MTLSEHVALVFRSVRKRRGLTQAQLADGMGTTERTISMVETGRHAPTLDTIEQLLLFLNISPREFFDFEISEAIDVERAKRLSSINDAARCLSDEGLRLTAQFLDIMAKHDADRDETD